MCQYVQDIQVKLEENPVLVLVNSSKYLTSSAIANTFEKKIAKFVSQFPHTKKSIRPKKFYPEVHLTTPGNTAAIEADDLDPI